MKSFLGTEKRLYVDIEMVMQAIVAFSVKHGLESILESQISSFENSFDQKRNMNEESVWEELLIALNGPRIGRCDFFT